MAKWLLVLAACYLSLSLAGGVLLVDRSLRRPRQPITAVDRERASGLARALGAQLEAVSIDAEDGATQRGWLFSPARPNSDAVLLLHGITSNRTAMLPAVRMFVEQGYRALAVDLRAHGESDGAFVSFGAGERDDLRRWIAWLRGAREGCVFEFGQSLGAGLALQVADAPGLCAVVAESAFASLREVTFDRIGQRFHTGTWLGRSLLRPGLEFGILYGRIRYGIDLGMASALSSVARPGAPILLIHGTEDDNLPPRHAALIAAANPARVTVWLVPGGTHSAASHAAFGDYPARVLGFMAAHRGR